jgi:hypothetical protein
VRDVDSVRIAMALERIADALELAVATPLDDDAGGCLHPLDSRLDFGVTNGVEDWQCGLCGFRTLTEQVERNG